MRKAAAAVLVIVLLAAAGFFDCGQRGKKRLMRTRNRKNSDLFFHNNPCESCHEGEKFRELVRDTLAEKQDNIPYWIDANIIFTGRKIRKNEPAHGREGNFSGEYFLSAGNYRRTLPDWLYPDKRGIIRQP